MYILFSEFNLLEFYKTIYKESTRIYKKNLLEFYKTIYKESTRILQKNLLEFYKKSTKNLLEFYKKIFFLGRFPSKRCYPAGDNSTKSSYRTKASKCSETQSGSR